MKHIRKIKIVVFTLLMAFLQNCWAVDHRYLVLGDGRQSVKLLGVAAAWDWEKKWLQQGDWHLTGSWEVASAYWDGRQGSSGNAKLYELAMTPVLRLQKTQPINAVFPYVDAGIGLHLLSQTKISDKRLSTALQFGDHVGLGARFGTKQRFDLGYRFQHISNLTIKRPNNGMNFHIIRFGVRF